LSQTGPGCVALGGRSNNYARNTPSKPRKKKKLPKRRGENLGKEWGYQRKEKPPPKRPKKGKVGHGIERRSITGDGFVGF